MKIALNKSIKLIEDAMRGVRVVRCEDCGGIGETLEGRCRACDGTGTAVINELEVRRGAE